MNFKSNFLTIINGDCVGAPYYDSIGKSVLETPIRGLGE